MSLQYIEELSLSHLLTDDDIDVLTRYPKFLIEWHKFFIPFLIKNILKYYYKSYWDDYLDGSHSVFKSENYEYEWHNEYKEFHRLNKPAMIGLYDSLHWRLNGEPYNSSGPTNITMTQDHRLNYIYFKDYYLESRSINYNIDKKTFSLYYYIDNQFILRNFTDGITYYISNDEALAIIKKYLPEEENKPLLFLPPIII